MYEFVEVESVEIITGREDTYDITVENTHNFFANGMLVHNCLGGVYAGSYWENRDEGADAILDAMRETTQKMQSIFGDRWYGELQWNNIPEQHELNQYIIQMHHEFGIELISTADSHYYNAEVWKDRELYKRLGWLGKGKPDYLSDELPVSVEEIGYELYPKNGDQMWESYKRYSKGANMEYDDKLVLASIERTHSIAHERIETFLPDNTVRLPDFVVPEGSTAAQTLAALCVEGARSLGLAENEEYSERLKYEVNIIESRGFAKYFLTMKAIADMAVERQLVGPGRGSAAGSLVSYVLGITQVDPIKYGLQFERFLTKGSLEGIISDNGKSKIKTKPVKIETDSGRSIFLTPGLEIKVKRSNKISYILAKNLEIGDEILVA